MYSLYYSTSNGRMKIKIHHEVAFTKYYVLESFDLHKTESFRSISLRIIGIEILPHKLFVIIVENEIKLIANAETAQFR